MSPHCISTLHCHPLRQTPLIRLIPRHHPSHHRPSPANPKKKKKSKISDEYQLLNGSNVGNIGNVGRRQSSRIETNVYLGAILAHMNEHFPSVKHLRISFTPDDLSAIFLTNNLPNILSNARTLALLKVGPRLTSQISVDDVKNMYCHEGVGILQYCRQLEKFTHNYPLSADYYPLIAQLSSLQTIERLDSMTAKYSDCLDTSVSPYAQNIVSINPNSTIVSFVKLQLSLIKFFSPSMTSLHLHGSKGLQRMDLLVEGLKNMGSLKEGELESEVLNDNIKNKNKVFFGLRELCVHVSDANYWYITKYLNNVPQLRRVQFVYSKKSTVKQLQLMLQHLDTNYEFDYSWDPNRDNLLSYYYNSLYYGSGISNSAAKLRYLHIVTKNTTATQNIELITGLKTFLESCKLTFLYIKLVVRFPFWNMDALVATIHELESSYVFKRDTMSYTFSMPFRVQQTRPQPPPNTHKKVGYHSMQLPPALVLPTHLFGDEQYISYNTYMQRQKSKEKSQPQSQSLQSSADNSNQYKKLSKKSKNERWEPLIDKNSLTGLRLLIEQKNIGTLKLRTNRVLLIKTRKLTAEVFSGTRLNQSDLETLLACNSPDGANCKCHYHRFKTQHTPNPNESQPSEQQTSSDNKRRHVPLMSSVRNTEDEKTVTSALMDLDTQCGTDDLEARYSWKQSSTGYSIDNTPKTQDILQIQTTEESKLEESEPSMTGMSSGINTPRSTKSAQDEFGTLPDPDEFVMAVNDEISKDDWKWINTCYYCTAGHQSQP